uniref:small monomeric GTPase n=1 Tax=Vombatus ursinus TaxID=29139 RepID=A0A4X2L4U4_VOMUR
MPSWGRINTNDAARSTPPHPPRPPTEAKMYKVVLMGTSCVGKSALAVQLIRNRFEDVYDPTIEDSYRGQIVVDGEPCQLDILDTTGVEQYYFLRDQFMHWGEGFLCVYAVDDFYSLEYANTLWDQVRRVKNTDRVPVVLVANKVDVTNHKVESTQGQEVAKSYGAPFVETSAKTRQGVVQAFEELVREIRKIRAEDESKRRSELEPTSGCGFVQCTLL